MKRFVCIAFAMLFVLCGCANKPIEVGEFSYTAFCEYYSDETEGIVSEGFVNTEKAEIESVEQVVELAKKECTVEYDTIKVEYDSEQKMYRVNFSEGKVLVGLQWGYVIGGDQSVCINHEGITQLIVYGE